MQHDDTTSEIIEMARHDFDAGLTMKDVAQIEEKCKDPLTGIGRRIAMLCLTRSKEEHVKIFIDNPDVFDTMLDQVESYQDELEMFTELANAAHARLLVAGAESAIRTGEIPTQQS